MKKKHGGAALSVAAGMVLSMVGASPVTAAGEQESTYIVVAQSGASGGLKAAAQDSGAREITSLSAIGAVVAEMTPSEAKVLGAEPGIVVAEDGVMSLDPGPAEELKVNAGSVPRSDLQAKATATSWGLDRIDQLSRSLNNEYNRRYGVSGAGAHAYVFDTGLAMSHPEFAGRVGRAWDYIGGGPSDCHGHGTHVSGTIGSNEFGVAPSVTIHPVRVLDCSGSGSWSGFIAALNGVAASNPPAASFANMSMGGSYNSAVNAAVTNFRSATNMPVVVAAGNEASNVAFYSPASTPAAISVAASEAGDWDAPYSNYGTDIDLYAPGTDIWSTYYLDPDYKMQLSGTSMAAPHVAGYLGLYLGRYSSASLSSAEGALISHTTKDAIRNAVGGTPPDMVYMRKILAPKVGVKTARRSNASKLYVNVNPNKGSGYWKFRVQKKSGGAYRNLSTVYKTYGNGETRTLNLNRGRYRVKVYKKYGYRGNTSSSVFLRR